MFYRKLRDFIPLRDKLFNHFKNHLNTFFVFISCIKAKMFRPTNIFKSI